MSQQALNVFFYFFSFNSLNFQLHRDTIDFLAFSRSAFILFFSFYSSSIKFQLLSSSIKKLSHQTKEVAAVLATLFISFSFIFFFYFLVGWRCSWCTMTTYPDEVNLITYYLSHYFSSHFFTVIVQCTFTTVFFPSELVELLFISNF